MTTTTEPPAPMPGHFDEGVGGVRQRLSSLTALVVLAALYVISFAVVGFYFGDQLPAWLDFIMVLVPIVVAWLLGESLKANWPEHRLYVGIFLAVTGLGVLLIAIWALTGHATNGFGFIAFVTGIVVIGQLVSALRSALADKSDHRIYLVVLIPAVLFVAGLGFPSSGWSFLLLVLGLVSAPVAIAVVSETVLNMKKRTEERRERNEEAGSRKSTEAREQKISALVFSSNWVSVTGLVLLLLGSWLTAEWLSKPFPAVPELVIAGVIAAAILLLVFLISADNVVDLLLVAVILSFMAFYESAGPPPVEFDSANGERVLVALGDSYMSGEGVGDFYDGTNEKGTDECRRSEKAYAPLMKDVEAPEAQFDQVIFLACSGADAVHVTKENQFPEVKPQLQQLQTILEQYPGSASKVDQVILSIGGNDAGFGKVARTCVIPGDCRAVIERGVLDRLPALGSYLKATYQDVRNRLADMGIQAPLVIVPYPVPIDAVGCEWSSLVFDANEHTFLDEFTNQLNNTIIGAAHDAGIAVVEPMTSAFVGNDRLAICSSVLGSDPPVAKDPADIGVNLIGLGSMAGSPGQITNPQNWFHNSMHPTEEGHLAMRNVFANWLVANDGTLTDVATGTGDVIPAMPELKVDSQAWMFESLAWFLKTHVWGPFIAALGAWLIAVRVIGWWRSSRRARESAEPVGV